MAEAKRPILALVVCWAGLVALTVIYGPSGGGWIVDAATIVLALITFALLLNAALRWASSS